MNWKDYEKEIYGYFKNQYPTAEVSYNSKILGRLSKTNRQIDILIEDYIAGNRIRIIIDGKYFSKRIDVKEVESFIGLLHDCEAHKGLLITQKGFSKAAIHRAYHAPIDIELDILNFKDLLEYQSFLGIPFSGNHGVILPSPFGWVIDNTPRQGVLATLYERGLTLDQAGKNKEWMYVNIKDKDEKINSLDDLLKMQEIDTINAFPKAEIQYLPTIKRTDADTRLREINIPSYPTKEYTGLVEFKNFIFFIVLFTTEELRKKNIRKLESIMTQVISTDVVVKSFYWDIEKNEKGSIMFLDLEYQHNINPSEHLTLTVAKTSTIPRPAFISLILPNNVDQANGIFISFGKTKYENDQRKIEIGQTIRIPFENYGPDTFTARIHNGYIKHEETGETADIFQKFLDFDYAFFLFTYQDNSHKSLSIPLFPFKEQYNSLE